MVQGSDNMRVVIKAGGRGLGGEMGKGGVPEVQGSPSTWRDGKLVRRMRCGSNVLLRGIFETGGKFESCWSEVILVIIKVKASNMTSHMTSY